jgi:hypothetical protein
MKPVVFHDLALMEFDEAAATYEERQRGLGARFRIAVESAIRRIQNNPMAGSLYGRTRFRFVLVRRFPYGVYYAVTDLEIQLIAAGDRAIGASVPYERSEIRCPASRSPFFPLY